MQPAAGKVPNKDLGPDVKWDKESYTRPITKHAWKITKKHKGIKKRIKHIQSWNVYVFRASCCPACLCCTKCSADRFGSGRLLQIFRNVGCEMKNRSWPPRTLRPARVGEGGRVHPFMLCRKTSKWVRTVTSHSHHVPLLKHDGKWN